MQPSQITRRQKPWWHLVAIIPLVLVTLYCAHATSYLVALEQKVNVSKAILRVSVGEVEPPKTKSLLDPAVCKATVLEVLKGAPDLQEVEFRFHAYGSFSPDKLSDMIGKEYYIFLHEPPGPDRPPNQLWVFEGPRGIRPIAEDYTEYRVVKGKVVTEVYSRSNYVARIHSLVQLEDKATGEKR